MEKNPISPSKLPAPTLPLHPRPQGQSDLLLKIASELVASRFFIICPSRLTNSPTPDLITDITRDGFVLMCFCKPQSLRLRNPLWFGTCFLSATRSTALHCLLIQIGGRLETDDNMFPMDPCVQSQRSLCGEIIMLKIKGILDSHYIRLYLFSECWKMYAVKGSGN